MGHFYNVIPLKRGIPSVSALNLGTLLKFSNRMFWLPYMIECNEALYHIISPGGRRLLFLESDRYNIGDNGNLRCGF